MPPMTNHVMSPRRRIVVLGSTGSIGTNCLDVVDHLSDRLVVQGLSAHSSSDALLRQAQRYRPRWVALTDAEAAGQFEASQLPPGCRLLHGPDAVAEMVQDADVDIVVTAIVGAAGLLGTWAALERAKPSLSPTRKRSFSPALSSPTWPRAEEADCCPSIANTARFSRPCKATRPAPLNALS